MPRPNLFAAFTTTSPRRQPRRTWPALLLLLLCSCATNLGSRSLPGVRINYMESVARSAEQQMLLNIVRLRHLRVPVFLQVSSIVTQFSLSTNVGVSGAYSAVDPGGFVPPGTVGASGGVAVEERPTITYTPLQGEEFVRRLATPLSPEAIAQVVQAGWPWDAILECCVQQINGQFAPASPWRKDHTDFQRLGKMLRSLQEAHVISVQTTAAGEHELVFAVAGTPEGRRQADEVRALLGLDPEIHRCSISDRDDDPRSRTLTLHGRSMLATLYYVSQGVEGESRGRPVLGKDALLHVRAAKKAPKSAYASVGYGDQAYFIADKDTDSQRVFVLLTYLFSLMSSPGGSGPLVTVGASG